MRSKPPQRAKHRAGRRRQYAFDDCAISDVFFATKPSKHAKFCSPNRKSKISLLYTKPQRHLELRPMLGTSPALLFLRLLASPFKSTSRLKAENTASDSS